MRLAAPWPPTLKCQPNKTVRDRGTPDPLPLLIKTFKSKIYDEVCVFILRNSSSRIISSSCISLVPSVLVVISYLETAIFFFFFYRLSHFALLQLDSATSLIQAAKNLMNAVVLTVKASYVASTKYQKVYGTAAVNSPVVSWRMKAPEKKPLVKREKPEECQTRVRRGSQKKHISPVQALSEFKAMDSF